jgi:hypothetical protein
LDAGQQQHPHLEPSRHDRRGGGAGSACADAVHQSTGTAVAD